MLIDRALGGTRRLHGDRKQCTGDQIELGLLPVLHSGEEDGKADEVEDLVSSSLVFLLAGVHQLGRHQALGRKIVTLADHALALFLTVFFHALVFFLGLVGSLLFFALQLGQPSAPILALLGALLQELGKLLFLHIEEALLTCCG